MSRDDMVAALERAAEVIDSLLYTEEAKIVRALADALRAGADDTYPIVNKHGLRASGPVWIIPEPKVKA